MVQNVFGVDAPLGLVGWLPAHRPREGLVVAELGRTGGDEQLGHLLAVHVFLDRVVGRRAQALKDQEYLVAFHELACLLDGLGRAEGVVIGDKVDLAAVDAALVVDHPEKGGLGAADLGVGRQRTAVGHDVADLDLGVGRAHVVFLLRGRGTDADRKTKQNACHPNAFPHHTNLPGYAGLPPA